MKKILSYTTLALLAIFVAVGVPISTHLLDSSSATQARAQVITYAAALSMTPKAFTPAQTGNHRATATTARIQTQAPTIATRKQAPELQTSKAVLLTESATPRKNRALVTPQTPEITPQPTTVAPQTPEITPQPTTVAPQTPAPSNPPTSTTSLPPALELDSQD